MEANDTEAFCLMGNLYARAEHGFPQDFDNSNEFYFRAVELGSAAAHSCLALSYQWGKGVDIDPAKAINHYEQAAIGGEQDARRRLAVFEHLAGNFERSRKHHMILANAGDDNSMKNSRGIHERPSH